VFAWNGTRRYPGCHSLGGSLCGRSFTITSICGLLVGRSSGHLLVQSFAECFASADLRVGRVGYIPELEDHMSKMKIDVAFQLEIEAPDSDAAEEKAQDQMMEFQLPANYVIDSL